jgi:hypothetical protein
MTRITRTRVFISYDRQDEPWRARLVLHLRPLERQGLIEAWDDTRLRAGTVWREEMARALACTRVAILLVSPRFLASDFIADEQLPPLLLASEQEGVRVLPLIVSACLFWETPGLSRFRPVNGPEQPLSAMPEHEQDAILLQVAQSVLGSAPHEAPAAPRSPDRERLLAVLNGLLDSMFSELVFHLPQATPHLPSKYAPQTERAAALLTWAGGPGGPGLQAVVVPLRRMLPGLRDEDIYGS